MSDNPYHTPQIDTGMRDAHTADLKLDRTVSMLSQTKPWVRFISVMTFIASAFMVLGGLAVVAMSAVGGAGGPGSAALPAFVGIAYIVMALLYIVPAIFLWKYANGIAQFVQQKSSATLATALEAQKSFWKFVGILMLVVMILYALIFVVAIGAALFSL